MKEKAGRKEFNLKRIKKDEWGGGEEENRKLVKERQGRIKWSERE